MPKFLAFIFLTFIAFNVHAQTWEVGGFAGGAGYMGDLNPNNPIKISGIAAGAYVKRNFNGYLAAKLSYTYGTIAAADSTSNNQQFRDRNLSFRTRLNEVSLTGEFNFMEYVPSVSENMYTPYIYAGIGITNYNPQANYQGQTYDLRPLMTEGQSAAYKNSTISVPYGVGIKYNIAGRLTLAADIGYRNTYTDYLDDVSGVYADKNKLKDIQLALSDRSGEHGTSAPIGATGTQRGDMKPRDTYLFVGFSISYTFITAKCYY